MYSYIRYTPCSSLLGIAQTALKNSVKCCCCPDVPCIKFCQQVSTLLPGYQSPLFVQLLAALCVLRQLYEYWIIGNRQHDHHQVMPMCVAKSLVHLSALSFAAEADLGKYVADIVILLKPIAVIIITSPIVVILTTTVTQLARTDTQSTAGAQTGVSPASFAESRHRCTLKSEEVGHGHVTAYVHVELYGFSMELSVQEKFHPVLAKSQCQYTRNRYCWNPLEMRFQKNKSTPFNPCVVKLLEFVHCLAAGKARLLTGFFRQMASCYPSGSVPTILHHSTGYCSFIASHAYLYFESVQLSTFITPLAPQKYRESLEMQHWKSFWYLLLHVLLC